MPQDISITIKLDYTNDTLFPTIAPYAPVRAIDIADEKAFFKDCGWFSGWGKELTGVDTSKIGGMALEGEWLFARKNITWATHLHGSATVPDEITVHLDSLKIGKSPIIASVSIDGVRVAIAITKTVQPNVCTTATYQMQNLSIPFPANAAWTEHNAFVKGKAVSGLASAKNNVNAMIRVEVAPGFEVNFAAIETSTKCAVLSSINPNPLLEGVNVSKSPYTVVAEAYDIGRLKGIIVFDEYKPSPRSSKRQSTNFSEVKETKPIKQVQAFTPPDGLEMPTLPAGYDWGLNVRGIILLMKNGQLFHLYEAYDLIQMDEDLASFDRQIALGGRDVDDVQSMRDVLFEQASRVRALYDYMEGVGNGIVLNYRIFKEYNPFS